MVLDKAEAVRHASVGEHLAVFYQPKIDLNNGKICGFEALLRLKPEHPASHLSTHEYVIRLENTGQIQAVGNWIFSQVINDLMQWRAQGMSAPRVSVNVSQYQLQEDDWVVFLQSMVAQYPSIRNHLEIEITENTLIEHIQSCIKRLHAIQALGIKVSIDDFGTGYSSLAYLKQLPINALKIDKSFIKELVTNTNDAVLVRAMIGMSHELGLRVIAEGVEEQAQINLLKKMHCDEVQGFYFSQAMPAAQVLEYVQQFQPLDQLANAQEDGVPTILLVDDEANITASIKRLLRGEKYRVLTASSGPQGLEIMASHHVSVVISDQRMPEMTGVEFLRAVKVRYPETIRMVLSGYTDLRSITDAINEGAIYKFLTKPWEDDVLLMNIHEAFQIYALKMENQRLTRQIQQANQELSHLNQDLEKYAIAKMEETRRSMNSLQVFHDIIQTIPLPMLGIDSNGLIVMENQQALALFSHGGASMMGCMADDYLSLHYPMLAHLKPTEACTLTLPDQQVFSVICQSIGQIDDVGKLFYFLPVTVHPQAGVAA